MGIQDVTPDGINLSFSGCGFLGLYHVGVAKCFLEYAPQCFSGKVSGTSAGAIIAAAIVCGVDLDVFTKKFIEIANKARENPLNSISKDFKINELLYNLLYELLPDDCHIRASGRLYISVTRHWIFYNKIISEYDTKADVINAILCSCFIPGWTRGVFQRFRGSVYIDGAFSANQPILDEHTVTVSPFFSTTTDISPNNPIFDYEIEMFKFKFSLTLENLYLLFRMIFAPHPFELTGYMCQGYNDAFRYMEIHNFRLPF